MIRDKYGLDQCARRFVKLCSRVTHAANPPTAAIYSPSAGGAEF
jgi:hypothetical protein